MALTDDDAQYEKVRKKISTIEWDISRISDLDFKETKKLQLEKAKNELKALIEKRILFGTSEPEDDHQDTENIESIKSEDVQKSQVFPE